MAEATTPADRSALPRGARTRFAPAPTGFLHLGHVANAIWVWGLAAATGGRVLLRIEDHDRGRCRPEYDAALLEDLAWLGFVADEGPVRQSDDGATVRRGARTIARRGPRLRLRLHPVDVRGVGPRARPPLAWPGLSRATAGIAAWTDRSCASALGGGSERWMDAIVGPCADEVAPNGDLPVRDRDGNWTYGFAVVVDDLRQDVGLVVRGRDLLAATAAQIRLARLLGREAPATFAHHPLIRRPDGAKLSKADGDTGVRDLRAAGRSAPDLIGEAAAAAGLIDAPRPIAAAEVGRLFDRPGA